MKQLHRQVGIIFLIAGVPLLYGCYQWLHITNPAPVYALIVAFAAAIAVTHSKILIRRASHRLFYLFFGVLCLATLLVWPRAGYGQFYQQLKSLLLCIIWSSPFIALYFVIRNQLQLRLAYRLLAATGILISASVIADYVLWTKLGVSFGEIVDVRGQVRAFGPLGDQVGFVVVLFFLHALARRQWLSVAFHATATVLTGTRGALLTLLVGVLWLLVVVPLSEPLRISEKARAIILTLGLTTVVVVGVMSSPLGEATYNRLFGEDALQSGLIQRTSAMQLGVRIFTDYPVLGVGYLGFNSFATEYGFWRFFAPGADVERSSYTANNQLIQTATDAGVPGVLAFAALFVVIIWNCQRARRSVRGEERWGIVAIESWLVAILVGNQTAVWLLPSAATGYFVFLAAAIAERTAEMQSLRFGQWNRKMPASRSGLAYTSASGAPIATVADNESTG